MNVRRAVAKVVRERVRNPKIRQGLELSEVSYEAVRNAASMLCPSLLTPSPRNLTVAITAQCNLRCDGCRYGRDYMPGSELPTELALKLIRESAAAGISTIRLYGGEPLLHRGLAAMVKECISHRITPYVSTNGRLLTQRLDSLYEAGLRIFSFGYYGHSQTYDSYVGRTGAWNRFQDAIADARTRYGEKLRLHMSYVLNTRTCSPEELLKAWRFAKQFELQFHVDLVHYSLPYFQEGPGRELQFGPRDRDRIHQLVGCLRELKQERQDLYSESEMSINSIPDWLLKGPAMRIPCDAYDMIWVGADGSVRLCFVTFPLGNLHQSSLREILGTDTHKRAARDALRLACPNCHCKRDTRVSKHIPSVLRYGLRRASTVPQPISGPVFPIIGQ